MDKLRAAIVAAVARDDVKESLKKFGLTAVGSTAAVAQQRHAEYTRFFTEQARQFNIEPE